MSEEIKKEEKRGRKKGKKALTIRKKIEKYTHGGEVDYHFLYNININQKVVLDNKWNLDLIDVCIFETIKQIYSHALSEDKTSSSMFMLPKKDELGNWAFISESYISKNIPLLPLNSPGAVYKRISKLESYNLVERHPNNKVNRTKLIRLGKNAKLFTFTRRTNTEQ